MTIEFNPFACGYHHLEVRRVLIVSYDDDNSTLYCNVHPSQDRLPDDALERSSCMFNGRDALAIEPDQATQAQWKEFPQDGVIRAVLRRIISHDSGERLVVGYAFDDQMAQQMVNCMSCSVGRSSRSWEISSSHLAPASFEYLNEMARGRKPGGLFFEAFKIPTSDAVGVKLLLTPWTDESLQRLEGISAKALREGQLVGGVPESLVIVLHLAAQAGVRFLVFDPEAAVLDGLSTFDSRPIIV